MMSKPATQAMAPSTTSTKRIDVNQNVPINLANGPRDAIPYLPTVNAMAPKAPKGANFIRMFTTPKTATGGHRRDRLEACSEDPWLTRRSRTGWRPAELRGCLPWQRHRPQGWGRCGAENQ